MKIRALHLVAWRSRARARRLRLRAPASVSRK